MRLRQGDFAQETVYADDPAAMARQWLCAGAEALHLVDLDGAKAGRPANGTAVQAIVAASAGVPCQLGGGLRTEADVETAFSWGVARAIIGTQAIADPEWLVRLAQRHPQRILLGLDVKAGKVAAGGWLETSSQTPVELLRRLDGAPLAGVIATDISRDGMMAGPDLAFYRDLQAATRLPLYASGGVASVEDLRALAELKLAGVVVGKALYERKLDLSSAVALMRRVPAA